MNPDTDQNYTALLTRLTLGSVLLSHGLVKLLIFTVPGTIAFFESLGLPAATAYLTLFGEIFGGSAILLGLYTRLAALLSFPVLLGALWAHSGNGWLFTSDGGGWEYPLLLIVLAGVVAMNGSGPFALRNLPVIDEIIPPFLRA